MIRDMARLKPLWLQEMTNIGIHISGNIRDGRYRCAVSTGSTVDIIRKQDQRSGRKTRGVVGEILTGSSFHPHGIKVRLRDGVIGRVEAIVEDGTE
jgi:uncharacterized repeat protein (TIGR03833 family)